MAAPFIPQVIVNTDFVQTSTAAIQPLSACIVGPHTQLVRYAQPAEKPNGALGAYVSGADTFYPWPHLATGGRVNLAYAKLFADNAKLVFYTKAQGTGQAVTAVNNKPNQIQTAGSAGYAVNGSHGRLAGLYNRDVQVGDRVRVSGVSSSVTYTLDTYITAITGPNDVAVTSAESADAANKATQSASTNTTQTAGTSNCWSLNGSTATYNGLADGAISDTYTVTVIQGSVGSDATTALIQVKSATGLDDVLSIAPAAAASFLTLGRRGLQLEFTKTGGSTCDLLVGQTWQVVVNQAFATTVATSGGTYTGASNDTYIITVTKGGLLADSTNPPQWTVTTVRGLDSSGPTTITVASQAYPIGTQGATLTLAGGTLGLSKGDRFYVPVTAAKLGLLNTLVLANPLPSQLAGLSDLNVWLYSQQNVAVPVNRLGFDPLVNFAVAASGITVSAGIVYYSPDFLDGSGNQLALPLLGADLFVQYQAYLPALANGIGAVTDIGDIDTVISGALDPDNPLKWAVSKALVGNAGTPVRFISVANPADPSSWTAAIHKMVGREDIYNIVPLTYDPALLSQFVAHVTSQSNPAEALERAMFVGLVPALSKQLVGPSTSSDGGIVLATLGDDPSTPGTQYTLLTVPTDNAKFIKNNVQPGDEARFAFTTSFGQSTYQSFTVNQVLSENALVLSTGGAVAVTMAQRLEIWHALSNDEIVADLEVQAANYANTRVCAVWSDLIGLATRTTETYFLAAAVAGLISGSLPHQALTNVAVDGFADVVSAVGLLNTTEIATLCGNGVWVISRTPSVQNDAVVTRLATTTKIDPIAFREEMIRRNVDSMVKYVRNRLTGYLGTTNVTPSAEVVLKVEVVAAHSFLTANGFTARLGPQLISGVLNSILPDQALADRFNINVTWVVPAPLNTIVFNASIIV